MERSALRGRCTHRCLLVFTSVLLLCEIVVGRLCNSLINTVDSFHTLYVLMHLTLHPLQTLTGASVTSIANPYTSPDPDGPVPQHPTSTTDGPALTPDSASSTTQNNHTVTGSATDSPDSEEDRYSTLRMQPFGAAVSALLLGSLCVSISLEIITHTLQPHVIKHPLLATAVGAASLLFNTLILIWRKMDIGLGGINKELTETQSEAFTTTNDKAKNSQQGGGSTTEVEEAVHHDHSTQEGPLHDGALMFCNPGAPSVLDPGQCSKECCSFVSCSETSTAPSTHSYPQSNHTENTISPHSSDYQQPQQTPQLTDPANEVDTYNACVVHTGWRNQVSGRLKSWNQGYMNSIVVVMHGLLGSVLVLVNGLALLLFGADCLQPHWVCHLLPYLDPVFSLATVLVLIARALPELRHHALMLLQAPPAHVHVEELTASIGRVPGVLAIHELHVWQLSEARLVASVHVHCPSGMGALECSELLVMVTEVLKSFGVSRCTVQPEFVAIHSDDPQSHAGSAIPDTVDAIAQPYCSLRCGKECARKMCCAPPEVHPSPTVPSAVDMDVRHQDIVIENTYL
ncbi:zinc transporter 1 [Pygocentrus nattereri]|uniref:zinc transporter 1 n=1 Tax=Pygocentrus nattereri TaxID=42514 RepID=UPI0008144BC7|nr:zinc transporter 1 [Pygocentrus nattereri]